MRIAGAALAGLTLALAACEPLDEAAVRAPAGAEAAPQPAANTELGREASDAAAREAAAEPEIGRTFVFDCDGGYSFTVRFGPGEMALWAPESLGGTYQVLSIERSGPALATSRATPSSGTRAISRRSRSPGNAS